MAPVRANQQNVVAGIRKTRSQTANILEVGIEKRKANASPPGQKRQTKRSAFGDLTNACDRRVLDKKPVEKVVVSKAPRFKEDRLPVENSRNVFPKQKTIIPKASLQSTQNKLSQPSMINFCKLVKPPGALKTKIPSRPKIEEVAEKIKAVTVSESKIEVKAPVPATEESRANESTESSLYVTALEELESVKKEVKDKPLVSKIPPGVEDFDAENWADPLQASVYAMDIFNYLKEREAAFPIDNYMERQKHLNIWMRSLLVDWMVEVQETFELNHETLYLAVKLVDLYLSKNLISKEHLQLVGAASIFVASKYDEQVPPLIEDFIYICDGAYTQPELTGMEKNIIKSLDFNLGVPLSYRFLRRYARCGKITLPDLTLARYILELSLMNYSFVFESDSKMGAAALLLALRMLGRGTWTPTLEYYSGYKAANLKDLAERLNKMLHSPSKEKLSTIRNKYSHKVFFEVAKIPLVDELNL